MKRMLSVLATILWIGAIAIVIVAVLLHHAASLAPIYAYNHPQGLLGWTLVVAIIVTVAAGMWPQSK